MLYGVLYKRKAQIFQFSVVGKLCSNYSYQENKKAVFINSWLLSILSGTSIALDATNHHLKEILNRSFC